MSYGGRELLLLVLAKMLKVCTMGNCVPTSPMLRPYIPLQILLHICLVNEKNRGKIDA